jgi:hypothetical protein
VATEDRMGCAPNADWATDYTQLIIIHNGRNKTDPYLIPYSKINAK